MNWKLLLIALTLILGISARPANDENAQETSTTAAPANNNNIITQPTNPTERPPIIMTESAIEIITKKLAKTTEKSAVSDSSSTVQIPTTTTTARYDKKNDKVEDEKPADENRELKATSNLQLTSGSKVGSELTLKESFHHGVAVPMTLEDYERELAREKELLNKAKKKISMESSTPKEGISTWILLSGSNDPTTTIRPEEKSKPAYRVDNESSSKKPVVKNNISNTNSTQTTKKRNPVTSSPKTTKTTVNKYTNNKLVSRVKSTTATTPTEEAQSSTTAATTKKAQSTTKTKKFTTVRPKQTQSKTTTTTTKATTTTTTEPKTTATVKKDVKKTETIIVDDSMVIDDEKDEPEIVETSTYLIMEAKDDEFNLPNDRAPSKSVTGNKKSSPGKATTAPKTKKKKISTATNSTTKIKKKSDKKTGVTKVSSGNKKPEKPITTQIYNYLAREVMPTVGVGLVGLVVTAGLATYFLGGPLTALRRSYDIASRRDDVAFDRSDDFGNMQDEGEMFGKVIAGMPENSPYRNNIRVNSYRVKNQPYQAYQGPQYSQQQQISKYGIASQAPQQQVTTQQQQQQYLRYRAADPYYNSYRNQYYQQQIQPKSNSYGPQIIQATENTQKFNIDAVDMTTSEPSSSPYSMDYEEIAQSYFPQNEDQPSSPTASVSIEQQSIQEVEQKPQSQYVQPATESERSEKLTIINAQSVSHKNENSNKIDESLPTPEALRMHSNIDDEYQNSIANAILSQNQKKFVVGSVIAENFEDNSASSVPEHGPRRRRKRETPKKPSAKSLENNEIDEDEKPKRETETEIVTTTTKTTAAAASSVHESSTNQLENEMTTIGDEKNEEISTTTATYDISGGQNNIFHLLRRIIELKLRLGLNFLQNATLAFQQYLRGVEERVQASPLFNPYANSTNLSRRSHKNHPKSVQSL